MLFSVFPNHVQSAIRTESKETRSVQQREEGRADITLGWKLSGITEIYSESEGVVWCGMTPERGVNLRGMGIDWKY